MCIPITIKLTSSTTLNSILGREKVLISKTNLFYHIWKTCKFIISQQFYNQTAWFFSPCFDYYCSIAIIELNKSLLFHREAVNQL